MLILKDVPFSICTDKSYPIDTKFWICESYEEEDMIRISLNAAFNKNTLDDEEIQPSFILSFFETNKTKISELIGMIFEVNTAEESFNREDMFYVWEHEPFEKLKMKIADINTKTGKAHIQCEGIAFIDCYTKPYVTAPFTFDAWVSVSNWEDAVAQFGI
ncbi:MAG: hypothetical protein FWC89_00455 [Defluviitaleaceae bacterium]|nr:hypothetical protein [Defluviitaleaceae bacterium]